MRRDKPTAASTWGDGDWMHWSTFKLLRDCLRAHPAYDFRTTIEVSHEDSAVVKTIDSQADAEATLANFKADIMFENPPFDDLTDEQQSILGGYEFAESHSQIGGDGE